MNIHELDFERPEHLQASRPPEARGLARDGVRLLTSTPSGHQHTRFHDLPDLLRSGDLLVVNRSATLAASLPAIGSVGRFIVNLSTLYGNGVWLAEPRWSPSLPGPLPLRPGEVLRIGGLRATLMAPHPRLPRLWWVRIGGDISRAMALHGRPIRYGYLKSPAPLRAYQTVFSAVPGSAEMPSAARPFTRQTIADLRARGIGLAGLLLHTGVSSIEIETDDIEQHALYAEPFRVPEATARRINRARSQGRRVIAVGTTVVRALQSAWNGSRVVARQGFTSTFVHPGTGAPSVDGLITGLHDPRASHLAMLYAVAGRELVQDAYREAVDHEYMWHEFGDSHLLLPS